MKTVEEIMERNDYEEVAKDIANLCVLLAEDCISKMQRLDLKVTKRLKVETKFQFTPVKRYLYLINEDGERSGALNIAKHSDANDKYLNYLKENNLNYPLRASNMKDTLIFVSQFKILMAEIDEIETKRTDELKDLLTYFK